MLLRPSLVALGAAAALALPATQALAATPVASWQMNEAPGSRTMTDSSGHGITGVIGSQVKTGVLVGSRKGYQFPYASASASGQDRLVSVADRPALDPGTRAFSVTVTFRTGTSYENLVQKGQSNTAGGFFKVDISKGILNCTFKGSAGFKGVGSGRALNDGAFHTVTCRRDSAGVSIVVDGAAARRLDGPTGTISNADALTIGGKKYCNGTTVGCDYFIGYLDQVVLSAG